MIAGGDYHSGLTAGRDGFVYTFGTATGTVLADEFAGAVIWGAAGQFLIEGDSGAFLANVAGFSGLVSSSAGNAGVIEMGQFTGTIEGALDAWIIGEGSLVGDVRGGQDAGADLFGSITGSVDAGRDALVFTYASLNGSVHADRDILRVYAKNGIDGSIVAERNIDGGEYYYDGWYGYASILSHGHIDASIAATGTSTWSGNSGHIGSVVAWGRIDGSIWVAQNIDTVRSADLIGAVITAPSVGSVIANDTTVLTQYPMPTVPASVLPELLQWRTDVLANWQSQTDAVLQSVASAKAAVALAVTDLRNQLSQAKADLEYEGQLLRQDLQQARIDGQTDLKASLDQSRYAALENDKQLVKNYLEQLDSANQRLQRMISEGDKAYAASVSEAERIAKTLQETIAELHASLTTMKSEFDQDARAARDWGAQIGEAAKQFALNLIPFYGMAQRAKDLTALLEEGGHDFDDYFNTAYVYAGNLFPGMTSIQAAWDGRDPWTLKRLSTFDRILSGIGGVLDVAGVVLAAGRVFNFFTAPCRGGWIFGECFVGDTKVLVARLPQGSTVAMAGAGAEKPDDMALGAACLLIGLGCAVTAFAVGNRPLNEPKQRKRKWNATLIDKVFSEDDSLDLLDDQFAEETALRRAGDVNPLIDPTDTGEVISVQSPEFSESHSFNSPASTATTLLIPTEHRTRKTSSPTPTENRKPQTENPPSPRPFLSRGLAAIAVVLLSVGGFLSLRGSGHTQPQPLIAAVEADRSESTSTPQYLSKRIADIQPIADRVLADNPETEGQAPSDFGEFNAADWRLLKLLIPKPDGEWLKVTLARPLTWIEESERDEHGRLWLEFEELGIANWADVLAIEPCPAAAVGEGRLVTGKFEHSSAEVIDLHVDGLSDPISTTSNHPFWSEDLLEFVQAGALSIGEHLRLANGDITTVTAVYARPGKVAVFNLEVDGEHVYYVSDAGVLVHNSGNGKYLGYSGPPVRIVRHHIFNVFRGNSPMSQKYRDFFAKHGIKVDNFAVDLPENFHKRWIHSEGRNWTTRWKQWIDANPHATTKDVFQQAGRMMDEYGISHLPIIPY